MEDGVLFTKQTISIQEAMQNPPLKDAVATPPKKPKAEQAFLFVADSSGKEGNGEITQFPRKGTRRANMEKVVQTKLSVFFFVSAGCPMMENQ